jgi:hypothetical protein
VRLAGGDGMLIERRYETCAQGMGETMSTIKLNSIHCVKKQDSISEDEIEVRVDGIKVAGPIGVHKGDTVRLGGIARAFTGTVSVQLLELDANSSSDNLGTKVIHDEPDTSGEVSFEALKHAFYTLSYSVT